MDPKAYDLGEIDIAWCPGCGNFGILSALKEALAELEIDPRNLVIVSGIGQAAKTPQYLKAHYFNGLHGRALPAATAIKASNPGLVVIAESGDGCMYGEGGNHFLHAVRRNPDITCIVHNNMVYGLTKGQASPTSQLDFHTSIQTRGVFEEPLNPIALAIALDASFVARAFSGDPAKTRELMVQAIRHRGFSLLDILQPCVSFNRVNTFKWFKDNSYYLDDSHEPSDRVEAFRKAVEPGKLALGTIFVRDGPIFEENLVPYSGGDTTPLFKRRIDLGEIARLMGTLR